MSDPETSPTVEDLAVEALALARIAATAIREEVLHRLAPQDRLAAEAAIEALRQAL